MKNRFFFFCLMAVMTVSCAKEQQEVIQMITDDPVFHATIENAGTRVYADDQLRVLWNANDHVSIFNKTTYNREYAFQGNDGDNSGTFKKVPNDDFITSNPLDYVYSVYPYNENTSISNDGEITVYLPAEQTYREDSFGLGANTMIAITEEDELMFKNLCGYFAIKLYGDNVSVSSITLKGNNNELLAGKATVVAQMDAAPTIQFDAANATKELTLTCATPVTLGTTAETATTFWFVVPPTTFEDGVTITVDDFFEKRATTSIEIKRNTLKKSAALQITTGPSIKPIQFADDNLKAKLVSAFDTNEDGELSYAEAAAVSSGESFMSAFGEDKSFSSFDEFWFFTGLETIPAYCFSSWGELTSITLPNTIKSIETGAFDGCKKLVTITIPNGVHSIGNICFSGSGLESIVFPDSVTSIGSATFQDCKALTSVVLPNHLTTISKYLFNGCEKLISITIPESVTRIESCAFQLCTQLKTISIPIGVNSITSLCFYKCYSLESITIPQGLQAIGLQAFEKCYKLKKIVLPESITVIDTQAFWDCSALESIILYSSNPPIGRQNMFPSGCIIYVPAAAVEDYKLAINWAAYANQIKPLAPLPEAVDLGLSVKWASFNLSASAPEGYGKYYAWGEIETKSDYSWETYRWCNGSIHTQTKYVINSSYGIVDNKSSLDLEDDAVHVNLGGLWRMPNQTEIDELINNCSAEWTIENGINGCLFTSKKAGYTDRSIFLPAAGYRYDNSLSGLGSRGYYWSSTIDFPANSAFYLYFDSDKELLNFYDRCYGFPIRPVCP